MIVLDMIKKIDVLITHKHYSLENGIFTLQIDVGDYDLTNKTITAKFSPKEVETGNLDVIDGIINLPIYSNLLKYGVNYIQLNFRWDENKLEQSPRIMWNISPSLAATEAAQEDVDIISYLIAQVQAAVTEADRVVDLAGDVRSALDESTEDAGQAKADLDGSISTAGTTKRDLDASISDANVINDTLANAVTGTIKKATDANTELEGSIVDAGTAKSEIEQAVVDNQIVKQSEFTEHKLEYVEQITDIKSRLQLAHLDHVKQEYVNLDQFWNSLRNGKIYTVEFNQFDVSPSPTGVKKDDNEGLVCEPSTNTIKGRNDYEKIGLFMSVDVNAYVDENDDYHVTAIKGDGRFRNDGTNGDVYVMAMPGYQKRYENDEAWGISYSDAMHPGFEILDEAVKPDGTIRPFLLHAKYAAGRNKHEGNNLASVSGVHPEYVGMSHNGQITEFKEKGVQYSGKTSHDDYYVQLMFWLKYATAHSQSIMYGCSSYYLQYENLVPETGVKRVITTNKQANNLLIGSCVSIGDYGDGTISADRNVAQNYNIANRVNIIDIVDLRDGNSAVYVDSPNAFNTTLTTTITTYPWTSGACDSVLGQDGSPTSNTSGKEPFIINGIEMMVGGYEVLQNLIIYNNNTDSNNYKIQVYACYDCRKYATSPTADYDLVGHELVQTDQAWKYISKIGIDPVHPTVMVPVEAEASSTTGFSDGVYTNTPVTGYRAWRSLGYLTLGAIAGLRCLLAYDSLGYSYWHILGRLSATGRSRRRAGVN